MSTVYTHARRLVVIETARTMAREAISATRDPEAGLVARRYYRGVEAAALHVLRPELAAMHEGTDWLEHRDPPFRDGYRAAAALLAAAAGAPQPPAHVRLPQPAVGGRRRRA